MLPSQMIYSFAPDVVGAQQVNLNLWTILSCFSASLARQHQPHTSELSHQPCPGKEASLLLLAMSTAPAKAPGLQHLNTSSQMQLFIASCISTPQVLFVIVNVYNTHVENDVAKSTVCGRELIFVCFQVAL